MDLSRIFEAPIKFGHGTAVEYVEVESTEHITACETCSECSYLLKPQQAAYKQGVYQMSLSSISESPKYVEQILPANENERTNERIETERMTMRQTTLNRRKVLVVEDDRDMAQLTRFLIEQFSGARCDIVVDSYEAIEALCDSRYDYLVVDQNLPGMKGIEVLMRLDSYLDTDPILSEQSRFSKKIPVLLMSAENITVPYGLKLSHFEITDRIHKRDLGLSLARNFAS